jgi:hypothetical protein
MLPVYDTLHYNAATTHKKYRDGSTMIEKQHLIKIANMKMPFGRYQGRVLLDLPDEYLLWFRKQGFPKGELGLLLELTLEVKTEGTDSVLQPLRKG